MKVRIYQDQPVPDSPGILVLSPTGDYAPFDFIECYLAGMPGQSYCAHQAQFVKFGSIVYRETEYINLLNQLGLVNIQPETLQDMLLKDQSTIVIDKDPQDIVTPAVAAVVADVTVTAPANQYSTTTDEIIPPTTTTTDTAASSTQAVSLPIDTSTTTPVTIPNATSTPPLEGFSTTTVPILDASTTPSTDPTAASTTDTTASTSTAAQVPASDSRLTAF